MYLPPPLNWLWKGWMAFSHVLGMIMSWIILTLLWITAFSIYGIILKVGGLFRSKAPPKSEWVPAAEDFENSMKYQF